jgi:hypothetical protein
MLKKIDKKIRLVCTIGICVLCITTTFSIVNGTSSSTKDTATTKTQKITTPKNTLFNALGPWVYLNWNFWTNPPNIFSRNTGNVGIGTTNPLAKLDVAGDIAVNGNVVINKSGAWVGSTLWNLNGNNIYYNKGSVGIGTTSPTAPLDVNGNVKISGEYKYTSPKTYYLNIPAAAFTSVIEDYFSYYNDGDAIWLLSPSFEIYLICPVNLPQEATVTDFRIYIYDNDTSYDIGIHADLLRRYIYSTSNLQMAEIILITSGSSPLIIFDSDNSIQNATIDNAIYQYHIWIDFNAHYYSVFERFYGCSIAYTMDTIAP